MNLFFRPHKLQLLSLVFCYIQTYSQNKIPFEGIKYECINNRKKILLTVVEALSPPAKTNYTWSTGETTQTILVDVEDRKGQLITCNLACECGAKAVSEINIESEEDTVQIKATNISCFEARDGKIDVSSVDNSNKILWAGSERTNLTNLDTGSYRIQIKDKYGCVTERLAEIKQPDNFEVKYNIVTKEISCFGKNDGEMAISFDHNDSASQRYSIVCDQQKTGLSVNNMTAGKHSLQIHNREFCKTIDFIIVEPEKLQMAKKVLTDFDGYPISCFNSSDAQIEIWPSGGHGPYMLKWIDSSFTVMGLPAKTYLDHLGAGKYPVEISDEKKCKTTDTIDLVGPQQLYINFNKKKFAKIFDMPCNGESLQINPLLSGGSGHYFYDWFKRTTQGDSSISNIGSPLLKAGDYAVQITDKNGCSLHATFVILEPDAVDYNSKIILNTVPLKIAILKMTGEANGKYNLNGKPRKRKIIFSMFKKNKDVIIKASGQGCEIRELVFGFSGSELQAKKKSNGHKSSFACPKL